MNSNISTPEREALTRELEHHIDTVCEKIIKNINSINNSINVTEDNFVNMTYIGEVLEDVLSVTNTAVETLIASKLLEKMTPKLSSITIKEE